MENLLDLSSGVREVVHVSGGQISEETVHVLLNVQNFPVADLDQIKERVPFLENDIVEVQVHIFLI